MAKSASKLISALLVLIFFVSCPGYARDKKKDDEKYKLKIGSSIYLDKQNARVFLMQSKTALRGRNVDTAIKLGRKAVQCDPEDVDARVALGEALFAKYLDNKDNPAIFNECVKTWLVIHRNVVGEEAASYKGISIPLANKFFADENRSMIAKQRLISLCGRPPKFFETNKKYLKRVLMPETQVAGEIVSAEQSKN